MQAALSAACAANAILQLPSGIININAALSGTDGCIVRGTGAGGGFASPTPGGTVINQLAANTDGFSFSSINGVVIEDLSIRMPAGTGACVHIVSSEYGSPQNPNRGTRIKNIYTVGGGAGINLYKCANYTIRDCFITDFGTSGIYLHTDANLPDLGDCIVEGNTVWDFNINTATACLWLAPQAGVEVIGNKFLGAQFGVYLSVAQGPTGTLNIIGNSLENQTAAHIYVNQTNPASVYGFITISGNETQNYYHGLQGMIVFADAPAKYLSDIIITSNNMRSNPAPTYAGIYLGGTQKGVVQNNVFDFEGTGTNYYTASSTSNAASILAQNNIAF
jgi:hypothetical protein